MIAAFSLLLAATIALAFSAVRANTRCGRELELRYVAEREAARWVRIAEGAEHRAEVAKFQTAIAERHAHNLYIAARRSAGILNEIEKVATEAADKVERDIRAMKAKGTN